MSKGILMNVFLIFVVLLALNVVFIKINRRSKKITVNRRHAYIAITAFDRVRPERLLKLLSSLVVYDFEQTEVATTIMLPITMSEADAIEFVKRMRRELWWLD